MARRNPSSSLISLHIQVSPNWNTGLQHCSQPRTNPTKEVQHTSTLWRVLPCNGCGIQRRQLNWSRSRGSSRSLLYLTRYKGLTPSIVHQIVGLLPLCSLGTANKYIQCL